MPSHIALNPVTVTLMWAACGLTILWCNYSSVREAWGQASARNPRKNAKFLVSFIAREQLAYAKRIPIMLGVLALCCALAVLIPGA